MTVIFIIFSPLKAQNKSTSGLVKSIRLYMPIPYPPHPTTTITTATLHTYMPHTQIFVYKHFGGVPSIWEKFLTRATRFQLYNSAFQNQGQ